MRAEGSRHDRDYTGEVKLLNAMSAFPQKRTFVVAGPFTFMAEIFSLQNAANGISKRSRSSAGMRSGLCDALRKPIG